MASDPAEEPPPLGRWGRVYLVVIGSLVLDIVAFTIFSWVYR